MVALRRIFADDNTDYDLDQGNHGRAVKLRGERLVHVSNVLVMVVLALRAGAGLLYLPDDYFR